MFYGGAVRLGFGGGTTYNADSSTNPTTTHPARQRIKFSDLSDGQRFFDPFRAEYFIKQSHELAAMITGIGDGSISDEFEPDDIVGVDV